MAVQGASLMRCLKTHRHFFGGLALGDLAVVVAAAGAVAEPAIGGARSSAARRV